MSPEHAHRARVYVSFADEDRARAMALVRWLNDSGWQVAADDRHSFPVEPQWTPPSRLDTCDVMLCVITPGWLASSFCHQEFSYAAKRGKFVLPVICHLPDSRLLPEALRALPRVDLTQDRVVDYLALRDTLNQAAAEIGDLAASGADTTRHRGLIAVLGKRNLVGLAVVVVLLGALTIWLLARGR